MLLLILCSNHIVFAEENVVLENPEVRYNIAVDPGGLPQLLQRRAIAIPFVSAHRGGPKPGFPENAVETFDQTTAFGPSFIEIDIRKSRDGMLLLMHDRRLDRTTTGTGAVAALDWVDMQGVNLRDNQGRITPYRIPTLDRALLWGRGRVVFMLDMKAGVTASDVLLAVQNRRAGDYVIFITRNLAEAVALHAADPSIVLGIAARDRAQLDAVIASGIDPRHIQIWTGLQPLDAAFYRAVHGAGMSVSMGTLGFDDNALDRQIAASGKESRYLDLYARGVDMISTDRHWAVHRLINVPALFAIDRRVGVCAPSLC